ncbi:MAG: hypothetical protein GY841_15405 [FCB group bacterium]|nr:hypothetical protein [FCB group bacterium]
MLYILNSFDEAPCGATLEEMENLSRVSMCEGFVDISDEESLFQLQLTLCSSHPMAISANMRWDDAGQLPLKDAIRILESLVKKNEDLAAEMKKK